MSGKKKIRKPRSKRQVVGKQLDSNLILMSSDMLLTQRYISNFNTTFSNTILSTADFYYFPTTC